MADDLQKKTKGKPFRWKFLGRKNWLPASVLVLGILSIVLVVLIDGIHETQHIDSTYTKVLMEMRGRVGRFHLWLEEAIAGDMTVEASVVWSLIEDAEHLVEKILDGGEIENGSVLPAMRDPGSRAKAEDIKSKLIELKALAHQRWQDPKAGGIGSVLDNQFDLLFMGIQQRADVLESAFEKEEMKKRTELGRLFWAILVVWTSIVVASAAGIWLRERRREAAEKALEKNNRQLQSQTEELETFREHLMELVEKRTMELIAINTQLQQEIVERKHAEKFLQESTKQVRNLCSQVLTIQEKERDRISKALHDELGGGMATLKLWANFIKRKLREDQTDLKEECGKTVLYIDRIIEDVHRLSWDLSPSVLQDLGLSKALHWLVNNLAKRSNINVNLDIKDFDYPLVQDVQITVYRIFQEALTNATKHAQAKNISVMIKQNTDAIYFSIEDDGKGFNVMNTTSGNAADGGLGLGAMQDRAKMLGGFLKIRSHEGKGTGITLQIPIEKSTGTLG